MGEREWVRRVVAGDREALDRLADLHRPGALRIARAVLGDSDAAEDVAQEVLVRLATALPGFRGDAELGTWLYRVTLNACRDHLRRGHRRSGEVSLETAAAEPSLSHTPDPADAVTAERLRDALRTALDRLPAEQREAVSLRYLSELSYDEIARITDAPLGTVASRVFRGLKRLGTDLEPRRMELLT